MKRATLLTSSKHFSWSELKIIIAVLVLSASTVALNAFVNSDFSLFSDNDNSCTMTDGGSIDGPETICSGEEITLTSVTTPTTNGTPEYVWIISYDGATWDSNEIVFTNSSELTTVITQTTWFRRCSVPEGCGWSWNDAKESNWVQVSLDSNCDCELGANAIVENNSDCGDPCETLCYESSDGEEDVSAQMSILINEAEGEVTIRTTYAKTFCDNTYGTNAIGWPGDNHTFSHLKGSDNLELALYDGNNDLSLNFEMDYLHTDDSAPSGYATGGVNSGDGSMIFGNESDVLEVRTSISENLNTFGYVLLENSPETDDLYTVNPAYPNWIYEVWYEVTISLDAFGSAGFGYPEITYFHSSPSKTGNSIEPIEFSECCGASCNGSIDLTVSNGEAPFTFIWSNGETTEDLYGLCDGDYTVEITDANGCSFEETFAVGFEPEELSISGIVTDNETCGDEGDPCELLCFESSDGNSDVSAQISLDINEVDGEITIRTTYAKTFCDNTYGVNAINWPGDNHTFSHLKGSDLLQLALYDANDNLQLEFKMDYLHTDETVLSGYSTGGVTAGDGGMISGNEDYILNVRTSISENLNTYGYLLTQDSPETDSDYTVNPAFPNWIYEIWYEVVVDLEAFSVAGFGYPEITEFHASPSKTGNSSEPLEFDTCCGTADDCNGWIDLTVVSENGPFTYYWSNGESTEDIYGLCSGFYTVTVTDINGCSVSETFEVNVVPGSVDVEIIGDNLICEGDDVILTALIPECDDPESEISATFLWSTGESTPTISVSEEGTYSVVVTDCNGCSGEASIEVDIIGGEPTVDEEPLDMTVECDEDVPSIPELVFSDPYDDDLDIQFVETIEEQDCGSIITRVWTVTNDCDVVLVVDQVITVIDTTSPVLMGVPADATIECDTEIMDAIVTAIDNCDDDLTVEMTMVTDENDCGTVLTRTWSVSDDCLNTTTLTQTINIVDTTVPYVVYAPQDVTIECDEDQPTDEATFADICDDELEVDFISSLSGNFPCDYYIDQTWIATDDCGNSTSVSRSIHIVDTTAPVFGDLPTDMTVDCQQVPAPAVVTATDSCNEYGIDFVEVVSGVCPYTITRTWTAADICGNSVSHTQVITVLDTTNPELVGVPANVTVECDAVPFAPVVTATDNCDPNPILGYNEAIIDADCGYTIERTWTATDNCQNIYSQTQTITVIDSTDPELIGVPVDMTVECTDVPLPAVVTATDNCDETLTVIYDQDIVDFDCGYDIVRTWYVEDDCENSDSATQIIHVVDTSNPVLVGVPVDATVECGDDTTPPMVMATDNCATTVPVIFTEVNNPLECGYELIRTWYAEDDCENWVSATATLTVVDTTPPILTGIPADGVVECGDDIPDAIVMATDICDGPVEVQMWMETIDNPNGCGATYVRYWSAEDSCGNEVVGSQSIELIDTTDPYLVSGPASVVVDCIAPEEIEAPVFADNCDEELDVVHTATESGDACELVITHTWVATDDCDNSESYSITVTVIDDLNPILFLPPNAEVDCADANIDPSNTGEANATDNCIYVSIAHYDGEPTGTCPITIERTWVATDLCGNTATGIQLITITDNTPPVISCPEDVTIECTESTDPLNTGSASAEDDCNGATINYTDGPTTGDCPYEFVRTWTATDLCGNQSVCLQTIVINDTQAPVLSGEDEVLDLECNVAITIIDPTATDNCDEEVELVPGYQNIPGDCPNDWTEIFTWVATDDCGNSATRTITVNYSDNTPPVLSDYPQNDIVECDAIPEAAILTADDNCDDFVEVFYSEVVEEMDGCIEMITRTWTATDDCENSVSHSQVLTVVDTTAPVASNVPADLTLECDQPEPTDFPTWDDNCDEDLTLSAISGVSNVTDCGWDVERSWTAVDDCGNGATVSQVIHFIDTTAPVLSGVPANIEVDCNAIPGVPEVTATDNCTEATIAFSQTSTDGCPYVITRTWTATDDCGNSSSLSQEITVVDNTAPILVGVPADVLEDCGEVPAVAVVTATDDCYEVEVMFNEVVLGESCPLTIERTWTATDPCGNSVSATQTIIFDDNIDPIFTSVPADVTVECDEIPAAGVVVVTDNCDVDPAIDFTEQTIPDTDGCGWTIIRTWTATDICENDAVATQTITVVDTTAPVLVGVPANITVECTDIPAAPIVTAVDNCYDGEMLVSLVETTIEDPICGYELSRTWSVSDNCGNSTSATQIITVTDYTDPEIETSPADVTIECDQALPTDEPTFSDNCDEDLTIVPSIQTIDLACGSQIIKTWIATDDCGNSVTATQIVYVIDTTDPVLVGVPLNVTVECDAIPAPAVVTATDNCSEDLEVVLSIVISETTCPTIMTRTWTTEDECGNSVSQSQVLTIVDTTDPILIGVPADMIVECDAIPAAPVVTAEDNCDEDVDVFLSTSSVTNECGYTLTRTWTAEDNCGNEVTAVQVLTVVDTTDPTVSNVPADATYECDQFIPYSEPTFDDNCDLQVLVEFNELSATVDCIQTITRTWTGYDDCLNSVQAQQVITIIDTTAPVLMGVPADQDLECGNDVPDALVTAMDNCDETLEVIITMETTDLPCGEIIERIFTVEDDCGNVASMTQVITVVDTTDPYIVSAPEDMTIECDEAQPTDVPVFDDVCDEELDLMAISGITNVTDCGYDIEQVWSATDDCGNSVSHSRVIHVVDTTAPVLNGVLEDMTVECDEVPEPANVTADDNCDETVEVEFSVTVSEETCPTIMTRTWTASDLCGNTTTMSQVLTIVDTTDPVFDPFEVAIEMPCDDIDMTITVSATDNCDEDVEINFTDVEVSGTCLGTIIRTYTAEDNCGNIATTQQIISVVDNDAPVLTGVPADVTVQCDEVPEIPEVTVEDNCSEVTVEFSEVTVGDDCDYTITRTWSSIDDCDNETVETQVIHVLDTTPPVILTYPADVTVECDQVPGFGQITVEDNCTEFVDVATSESSEDLECGYVLTRTWIATDNCDNVSSVSQTIVVVDTTAPELLNVPAGFELECGVPVPGPADVDATDNCDPSPVVSVTETTTALDCGVMITRTYTATDNCGNFSSAEQIITIIDTIDPILIGVPEDITVSCEDANIPPMVTAEDICDDDVEVVMTEVIAGECPYTITRTWTATDDCGNWTQDSQVITVFDDIAPVFDDYPFEVDVECDAVDSYIITAFDNCDVDVEVTWTEEVFSGSCYGVLFRTYTATDNCGNSVSTDQFVHVVDTSEPVILNVPADETYICDSDIPEASADVTAEDNCAVLDFGLELTFEEIQTNDFCPYQIIRTWTAVDDCGNVAVATQIIDVIVDTPEQISIMSYPNPFNDQFTVEFTIPKGEYVHAGIYDMTGRCVEVVFDGEADAHRLYEYEFNNIQWDSGSYIIRMMVGDELRYHRIVLQK